MTWTEEEIEKYNEIRLTDVEPLYKDAGIPLDNPEERARYLTEDVLKLTMTDHDVIMSMAKKEGESVAET